MVPFEPVLSRETSTLSQSTEKKITEYVELLLKWNKAFNLTAITSLDDIGSKHIADSLAVADYIHGQSIIDVGTGAGLPGIPLAMALPEKQFTLLDSNGKKIRFLKQVVQALNLKNVTPIHARVEDFQPESGFDMVISRAFASICDMLHGSSHLACDHGRFLAMKGMKPKQELEQLPPEFTVVNIHMLNVPGLTAERCLVEIARSYDTNAQ